MKTGVNYYEILQCEQNATHDQLKENYQKLAKKYHPDKNCGQSSEEFLEIDKAWKVLRDPRAREEYDAHEFCNKMKQGSFYPELKKEELVFDENLISSYPCRCGCYFEIHKEYTESECLVECSGCSNCLCIK